MKDICPKCKKGTLVFGTSDLYCSENCGHREPHRHGPGPYTCTCGPSSITGIGRFTVSTDKLDEIIGLQQDFQRKYDFHRPIHEWAAAMAAESGELWGASGGKWWKKKSIDEAKYTEELVDILHFFLGFMIDAKITPDKLVAEYKKKLAENYKRQESGY